MPQTLFIHVCKSYYKMEWIMNIIGNSLLLIPQSHETTAAVRRDANLLTQKIRLIKTKSSETIAKYHNFFHLRMLAQRHDSNSYS